MYLENSFLQLRILEITHQFNPANTVCSDVYKKELDTYFDFISSKLHS